MFMSNAAHSTSILVAEQESAVRTMICEALRLDGYKVIPARDGRQSERDPQ